MVKINKKKKENKCGAPTYPPIQTGDKERKQKKKKTKEKKSLSTMISVKRFCEGAKLSVFFFFSLFVRHRAMAVAAA